MSNPVNSKPSNIDIELLIKKFVDSYKKTEGGEKITIYEGYNTISSLENKALRLPGDLVDALNSSYCVEEGEQEVCSGRLDGSEVTTYFGNHPDRALSDLLRLQNMESRVGHPLFTPSARTQMEGEMTRAFQMSLKNQSTAINPDDFTNMVRQEIDSPINGKELALTFEYKGTQVTLQNGGVLIETRVWDPVKVVAGAEGQVSQGAYDSVTLFYSDPNFFVSSDGLEIFEDLDTRNYLIRVLGCALKGAAVLDKIYADENGYQLINAYEASGPKPPIIMVAMEPDADKKIGEGIVKIEARRGDYAGDTYLGDIKVALYVDIFNPESPTFIREERMN